MKVGSLWRRRKDAVLGGLCNLLSVVAAYLLSELAIWGISRILDPLSLNFFSSSLGMVLVFLVMTLLYLFWQETEYYYQVYVKSKVDFINLHLGVGFPVPIIMLDQDEILDGHDIACVIASFVVTNIVSWLVIYFVSLAICQLAHRVSAMTSRHIRQHHRHHCHHSNTATVSDKPPRLVISWLSDSSTLTGSDSSLLSSGDTPLEKVYRPQRHISVNGEQLFDSPSPASSCKHGPSSSVDSGGSASRLWSLLQILYPIIISFSAIFLIGIPIAVTGGRDERVLDTCVLWFCWISSVRLQQTVKSQVKKSSTTSTWPHYVYHAAAPGDAEASGPTIDPGSEGRTVITTVSRWKEVLATLLNPVLLTTLLMTAYTRAKASALPDGVDLTRVLAIFSSGIPLYSLWTAAVADGSGSGTSSVLHENTHTNGNPALWFGAGDLALSLLECGILLWGFKLFECRRQLYSVAGLFTALVSVGAAAGNVFLSVLVGRLMGLDEPEALSFAARCTTLALAKPAIQAVGGNLVVNAAVVVSNGILGQLCYPFVLEKLGVKDRSEEETIDTQERSSGLGKLDPQMPRGRESALPLLSQHASLQKRHERGSNTKQISTAACYDETAKADLKDSPETIAAGIAIGINGAAMGVAYLYERKSRAAPYAALAMTIFGVSTVVFTTVNPFKGIVMGLASH